MKSTNLFYLFAIVIFFSSCSNKNFSDEKIELKKIETEYQLLNEKVNAINISQSKEQLKKYNTTIEGFKTKLETDKLPSKETMQFINQFRSVKQTFKYAPKRIKSLKSTIKLNTQEVENLKQDINNNVFDKKQLAAILNSEQNAIKNLSKEYKNLVEEMTFQIEKFDSLLIKAKTIELK